MVGLPKTTPLTPTIFPRKQKYSLLSYAIAVFPPSFPIHSCPGQELPTHVIARLVLTMCTLGSPNTNKFPIAISISNLYYDAREQQDALANLTIHGSQLTSQAVSRCQITPEPRSAPSLVPWAAVPRARLEKGGARDTTGLYVREKQGMGKSSRHHQLPSHSGKRCLLVWISEADEVRRNGFGPYERPGGPNGPGRATGAALGIAGGPKGGVM